jgi:hypothetical protein
MMNPDAMYRQTLDRQQQLLDEAARIHGVRGSADPTRQTFIDRRWRSTCAALLRQVADRLEPAARQSQLHA